MVNVKYNKMLANISESLLSKLHYLYDICIVKDSKYEEIFADFRILQSIDYLEIKANQVMRNRSIQSKKQKKYRLIQFAIDSANVD